MAENWAKTYSRINWVNRPNSTTALGATNLNTTDYAINELDNRVISLNTTKLDIAIANTMVKDVSMDMDTGIITVTQQDGTSKTYDTKLEKLAINFAYDESTQQLVITLDDGTIQYVDMSALITQYEFNDTDTIAFSTDTAGEVSAQVVDGSITEDKLQPNYLADIKVQTAASLASQTAAATSETNAKTSEANAKASEEAAATSETNSATSEANAKEYSTNAASSATSAATSATNAASSASTATSKATAAASSASAASTSETNAATSETNAATSETNAKAYSVLSQSYAVGGTSSRIGEDTDNAKYYKELAEQAAVTITDLNLVVNSDGELCVICS